VSRMQHVSYITQKQAKKWRRRIRDLINSGFFCIITVTMDTKKIATEFLKKANEIIKNDSFRQGSYVFMTEKQAELFKKYNDMKNDE
jgi:hypothetical protein